MTKEEFIDFMLEERPAVAPENKNFDKIKSVKINFGSGETIEF